MRFAISLTLWLSVVALSPAEVPPAGQTFIQPGEGSVDGLVFSDDGKTLLTTSRAAKNLARWVIDRGHNNAPSHVRNGMFGLATGTRDGKLLAVTAVDKPVVTLHSGTNGTGIATLEAGEGKALAHLTLSSDGKWLAGSNERHLLLWDITTRKIHRRWKDPLPENATFGNPWFMGVSFSRDGKSLLFAEPGKVTLWDLANDKEATTLDLGPRVQALAVALSADGKRLATGEQNRARLWDVGSGKVVAEYPAGNTRGVAFSADGKLLAVAGRISPLKLWDTSTTELRASLVVSAQGDSLAVDFSPDGRYVAGGGADLARVWDLARVLAENSVANDRTRVILPGSSRPTTSLAFRADGQLFACANGASLVIYDAAGKEISRRETGFLQGLQFAPDGSSIVGCQQAALHLWPIAKDGALGEKATILKPNPAGVLYCPHFTADSSAIVVSSAGNRVHVFEVASSKQTLMVPFPRGIEVREPVRSDVRILGGGYLMQSREGPAVRLDLATGQVTTATIFVPNTNWRTHTADGKIAIGTTSSKDRPLLLERATGRETELTGEAGSTLFLMALASDGRLLAGGAADGSLHLWDIAARKKLARIPAHVGFVQTLTFAPDGRTLVTTANDGAIKLWDVAKLIEPLGPVAVVVPYTRPTPKAATADERQLGAKAQAILRTHCHRCHGQDGSAEGGFSGVLDPARLLHGKRVVAGEPNASRLLKRITQGEMPPEDEKVRPSDEKIATLRAWIKAGAPDGNAAPAARPFISPADVLARVRADRAGLDTETRRRVRYFTLAPLYNAGWSDDELHSLRLAFAKLINSVSSAKEIVNPVALDEARTLLRIDPADYGLVGGRHLLLDRLDPYSLAIAPTANAPVEAMPIRADAFLHTAARPPHYHALLNLPETLADLEQRLDVDVGKNVAAGKVVRAGFNGSGVARFNRMIERHEGKDGYYWRSYDFAGSRDRQNLFKHPLGPPPGANTFQHDGGEVIFRLPNGLQGYFLADAQGNRIDRGPTNIVADPKHPERVVENGISCMSCHARGLIDKVDQIRPHAERNRDGFDMAELTSVLKLYVERESFRAVVEKDQASYRKAVTATGVMPTGTEPIVVAALRFEAPLDLEQAAAELWTKPETLCDVLDRFPGLARSFGVLRTPGGTVSREEFQNHYGELIDRLKIGTFNGPTRSGIRVVQATPRLLKILPLEDFTPTTLGPQLGGVELLGDVPPAFSPSLHRVAVMSGPNTFRLIEPTTSKIILTLDHQTKVSALAFSPDGTLLASAGHDESVRIWVVADGELKAESAPRPNPNRIDTLAFRPDNKVLVANEFRGFRLIDVESLKVIDRFNVHSRAVTALAFSPTEPRLVSIDVGATPAPFFWELEKSRTPQRGTPVAFGVSSITFLPDGRRVAGLSTGGQVHLWDARTRDLVGSIQPKTAEGKELSWTHQIVASLDGKYLATAHDEGYLILWDAVNFQELVAVQAHPKAVLSVGFSADGRRLGTADKEGRLRFWSVRELLGAAAEK